VRISEIIMPKGRRRPTRLPSREKPQIDAIAEAKVRHIGALLRLPPVSKFGERLEYRSVTFTAGSFMVVGSP
jgi:hypothetical protein